MKIFQHNYAESPLMLCFVAVGIGVISALGAWFLRALIGIIHNLMFLGKFSFEYDSNLHTLENPWGLGIIAVPVIGSVFVTWLVKTFAAEAKGHGVPEVLDAIHYSNGKIRGAVAIVKALSSAICIGSGGSVGREGPIVQIGSAFGSQVACLLKLSVRHRITLIACGAAGGIAATFNTPIGGVLFAVELLLVSINSQTLLPVALSSVTATYIGRAIFGTYPAFNLASLQISNFELSSPMMIILFIPFGILIGLSSVAFIKGIYWSEDKFDELPMNDYLKHGMGMFIVGCIMYLMITYCGGYYIQGVGYAAIMDMLTEKLSDPLFLMCLFGLKMVATFLTLGSGGSGGIFSPALFLGGACGSSFAILIQPIMPAGIYLEPSTFALAGMAASVGSVTGAILTATVMLHELTADYSIMLPAIATTTIACATRKIFSPPSIYTLKLIRRGHIVPDGLQSAFDEARQIRHVMEENFQIMDCESKFVPYDGVTILTRDGLVKDIILPLHVKSAHPDSEKTFIVFYPETPLNQAKNDLKTVMYHVGSS